MRFQLGWDESMIGPASWFPDFRFRFRHHSRSRPLRLSQTSSDFGDGRGDWYCNACGCKVKYTSIFRLPLGLSAKPIKKRPSLDRDNQREAIENGRDEKARIYFLKNPLIFKTSSLPSLVPLYLAVSVTLKKVTNGVDLRWHEMSQRHP